MAVLSKLALAASLALCGVSAAGIPQQQHPLTAPSSSSSSSSHSSSHKTPSDYSSLPLIDTEALQDSISVDALFKRAEKFYKFAQTSEEDYGHPTRVIGSTGHERTLNYIVNTLLDQGDYYSISTQEFPVTLSNVFESQLVLGNDVSKSAVPMGLTPATKDREPVHGHLVLVKNNGCDASDYPENVKGNIAFIRRGQCAFGDKSIGAGKAGAKAAVIYNTDPEELHGTLGEPTEYHVATFGIDGTEGKKVADELASGESVSAIAYIDAEVKKIQTVNVLAQTDGGDPDNCVMLGGHSDGVAEGPGINDDGSGSMSVLEVAVQLTKFKVNNCVRFAWWAAEEEGLLGSDFYAASLSEEENQKIRLFMDYDMMASPNFAYQIYNATNAESPAGSEELRNLYVDWYKSKGLNYTFIPFDGRSDYDGFIRAGIPAGGIATGAEAVKTKEEAEMFGGRAGEWLDPCYHQLCDDLNNLNRTAWEVNTKLIAHSVATYALSFDGFPKRELDTEMSAYGKTTKHHGPKLIL
ncbi:peptidase family m28 domain-containing protein [Trichoderma breve]|uniref:Peptide hydrolase n=1 Tax=Trichoderma breve TaxID=2034170 RepID=A0A9W9BHW6_9HYPO|nr:peptidase family m28 domain-containing protein [Trichoderma breve]KAJ4860655.1 peptidase family m28 domain-containing protein [Trichoderma breve]